MALGSRTPTRSESHYPAIEKEAASFIEAVRKWSHYLHGKAFNLVTDQKSLAFMFNSRKRGKIKNAKIMMWRIEPGAFSNNIVHKPGKETIAPDTFSRVCANTQNQLDL